MKDSASGHGVVRLLTLALICVAIGAVIGFADLSRWVLAACGVAVGVLMARYLKSKIAYLYAFLYGGGYVACRMLLESHALH
ncbi:MAG TPA: hypothetical protein VJ843_05530 [Candidatus Saccharimonadales bacterium]|nr:hypothetical protein [Candidatus Saccharimonadales bacterium]